MWGPLGEQLVAGGAIIIMMGSLNSGFLATSRLPFAFAEQGDFPAVLTRVHARFRTPHVAILGSAAIVLVATLASSFLTAITLAASTRIAAYIAGCAALIVMRRRADVPPSRIRSALRTGVCRHRDRSFGRVARERLAPRADPAWPRSLEWHLRLCAVRLVRNACATARGTEAIPRPR
jgi:hypothetical protein